MKTIDTIEQIRHGHEATKQHARDKKDLARYVKHKKGKLKGRREKALAGEGPIIEGGVPHITGMHYLVKGGVLEPTPVNPDQWEEHCIYWRKKCRTYKRPYKEDGEFAGYRNTPASKLQEHTFNCSPWFANAWKRYMSDSFHKLADPIPQPVRIAEGKLTAQAVEAITSNLRALGIKGVAIRQEGEIVHVGIGYVAADGTKVKQLLLYRVTPHGVVMVPNLALAELKDKLNPAIQAAVSPPPIMPVRTFQLTREERIAWAEKFTFDGLVENKRWLEEYTGLEVICSHLHNSRIPHNGNWVHPLKWVDLGKHYHGTQDGKYGYVPVSNQANGKKRSRCLNLDHNDNSMMRYHDRDSSIYPPSDIGPILRKLEVMTAEGNRVPIDLAMTRHMDEWQMKNVPPEMAALVEEEWAKFQAFKRDEVNLKSRSSLINQVDIAQSMAFMKEDQARAGLAYKQQNEELKQALDELTVLENEHLEELAVLKQENQDLKAQVRAKDMTIGNLRKECEGLRKGIAVPMAKTVQAPATSTVPVQEVYVKDITPLPELLPAKPQDEYLQYGLPASTDVEGWNARMIADGKAGREHPHSYMKRALVDAKVRKMKVDELGVSV